MIEDCPRCGYGPIDRGSARRKKCPACYLPFVLSGRERPARPDPLDDHPRLFDVPRVAVSV